MYIYIYIYIYKYPKRRRAASPPPRLDRDSGQNLINQITHVLDTFPA